MSIYNINEKQIVQTHTDNDVAAPVSGPSLHHITIKSAAYVRFVELRFATYQRTVFGKMEVLIQFSKSKDPVRFILPLESVKDNELYQFDLGANHFCSEIIITLNPSYHGTDFIALWLNQGQPSHKLYSYGPKDLSLKSNPLISIITAVYKLKPSIFKKTFMSVLDQTYDNWEWIIIDDGSDSQGLYRIYDQMENKYPGKIKVTRLKENVGISEAQNVALGQVSGEWFFTLDHDDAISNNALLELVVAQENDSDLEMIYTDEDKIDEQDNLTNPFYKPDWSPRLLLSQNYICHLCAFKTESVRKYIPQGYEKEFDGSQDYRFLLNFVQHDPKVLHIPKILYHWRILKGSVAHSVHEKPYALRKARVAIERFCKDKYNAEVKVFNTEHFGLYRPYLPLTNQPSVDILIPSKDMPDVVENCLDSLSKTTYGSYTTTVIDNGSTDPRTEKVYKDYKSQTFRVIKDDYDFNFSKQVNTGVNNTKSPYILLLNNDTEVINPHWLSEMVSLLETFPDVAVVGCRLLYPNGTIQHAGVDLGVGGVAGHTHRGRGLGDNGYFGRILTVRECSAVTGACMLIRRSVYNEVEGFNEELPRAFNDVDFCLKVRKAGHNILYTPWSCLYHHESISRGQDKPEDPIFRHSINYMKQTWGYEIANDPYFNPNFSRNSENYEI